jgi:hypothetical protein
LVNETYLIIIMATIFDNIILDEIENSKISFLLLVRLLKERINQNAKRKLYAIVERERQWRCRKKRTRETLQNKSLPLFIHLYLDDGTSKDV